MRSSHDAPCGIPGSTSFPPPPWFDSNCSLCRGNSSFSIKRGKMLSYLTPRFTYAAVDDDEYVDEPKHGPTTFPRSSNVLITTNLLSVLIVTVLFLSSIVSSWVAFFKLNASPPQQQSTTVLTQSSVSCQEPPIRREWRTLTLVEKNDYIRAVRCLASKPSTLGINGTLYDDFPWVHKHTSSNSTFIAVTLDAACLTVRGG